MVVEMAGAAWHVLALLLLLSAALCIVHAQDDLDSSPDDTNPYRTTLYGIPPETPTTYLYYQHPSTTVPRESFVSPPIPTRVWVGAAFGLAGFGLALLIVLVACVLVIARDLVAHYRGEDDE